MFENFQETYQNDPLQGIVLLALCFLLYLLLGLGPICGFVYLVYHLVTLPMRRAQRARMFLDFLEAGMKEGRSPEAAIIHVATSRDSSLGARFHMLAAWLEKGLRLGEGLTRVPRLLPPQLVAMLRAGERIGDVAKVIPAGRRLLADSVSQVRGALNYLLLLVFAITPAIVVVPVVFRVKVLPSFEAVFSGMLEGAQMPAFSRLVFGLNWIMVWAEVGLVLALWLLTAAYLGGPRLQRWLLLPRLGDWLQSRLPWRRQRMQRDFSAMLAVLLDAGVPEAEALTLAGEATASPRVAQQAAKARLMLGQGSRLADALRVVDDSGELRWRLANTLQRGSGFLRALTGWHEALEARAFQSEQAAAHLATSALVLINGFLVACVVIAVFLLLVNLINVAALW